MKDPFEGLRPTDGPAGDPAAIRRRAARMTMRRRAWLGGTAAAVALIAILGAAKPWEGTGELDRLARSGAQPSPTAEPMIEVGPEEGLPEGADSPPGSAPLVADGSSRAAPAATAAPAWGQVPTASPDQGDLTVELLLDRRTVPEGETVRMTLRVCNRGSESVDVTYPSGKDYDFEAWQPGDEQPSWRWSHGSFFTQAVREERFGAGECRSHSEAWDGRDDDDRYVDGRVKLVGVVASSPELRTAPEEICLGRCS